MKPPDREFEHTTAERDGATDALIDRRPVLATGRPLMRYLALWGEKVLMGTLVVAALIGLAGLSSRVVRPDRQDEDNNRPDGGIIVRSEVLRLWLPEPLIVLAKRQSWAPVLRDHGELQRFLELDHQEDLWHALTIRGHQANGGFADITFIRRPYTDSQCFPELLNVLAVAAGNAPHSPTVDFLDFSTASVHVMPSELWKRDPREAIADLEFRRSLSVAQEGARWLLAPGATVDIDAFTLANTINNTAAIDPNIDGTYIER